MNRVSIQQKNPGSQASSKLDLKEKIRREKIARKARDEQLRGIRSFMGIREVQPHVEKAEVKDFLKTVVTDKAEAVEILILNSIVNSSREKSLSYELLSTLNYSTRISDIKKKQRVALVEAIADAVDEMAKLSGSFNAYRYNIFFSSDFISTKLLRSLTPKKRCNLLQKIVKNGEAKSWLIYFARSIIQYHETGHNKLDVFIPWLAKSDLETLREITVKRLLTIMKENYYDASDPLQFFLFWIYIGSEDEKDWFRDWIKTQTISDEDFVKFVKVFTGKATLRNGTYPAEQVKIAYTETIGSILEFDAIVGRLQEISKQDDEVGEKACELVQTVEYTLSARERGQKMFTCYL